MQSKKFHKWATWRGGVVIALTVFAACGPTAATPTPRTAPTGGTSEADSPSTPSPTGGTSEAESPTTNKSRGGGGKTDDEVMCQLDRRFRGFAGAFQDRGVLVLLFAKGSSVPDASDVKQALAQKGFAVAGKPAVRYVTYSFCTLKRWYDRLFDHVFQLDGVVAAGIDERRNRLVIGVADKDKWEPEVEAMAQRLRVPRRVIRVEEMGPFDVDS